MTTMILGVETSCDETAAAVVADGRVVHSNVVASQVDIHRRYGALQRNSANPSCDRAARGHVVLPRAGRQFGRGQPLERRPINLGRAARP